MVNKALLRTVAYLEIWKGDLDTFQVSLFQSVQNLSYFFTLNISTILSPLNGGGRHKGPLNMPVIVQTLSGCIVHLYLLCPGGRHTSIQCCVRVFNHSNNVTEALIHLR